MSSSPLAEIVWFVLYITLIAFFWTTAGGKYRIVSIGMVVIPAVILLVTRWDTITQEFARIGM